VWLDDLPRGDLQLVRGSAEGALRVAIGIDRDGAIEVVDQRNTTILRTSESVRTDRWIRIEWMVDHTRGVIQVRLFNYGTGTTPSAEATSPSGRSIGSSADRFQFGASGRQSFSITFWTDSPAISSSGYPTA
jgi:hypothetical protein